MELEKLIQPHYTKMRRKGRKSEESEEVPPEGEKEVPPEGEEVAEPVQVTGVAKVKSILKNKSKVKA